MTLYNYQNDKILTEIRAKNTSLLYLTNNHLFCAWIKDIESGELLVSMCMEKLFSHFLSNRKISLYPCGSGSGREHCLWSREHLLEMLLAMFVFCEEMHLTFYC